MKKARILVTMLLVLIMALPFVLTACNKGSVNLDDVVERTDYTSVYEKIGSKVTIDMVKEDSKGLASVTVDGKTYELGMDFLSMAMVYNTEVPESWSKQGKDKEDVYNEWWKLYIQRWNYLVPEVPLYSNIYYDVYNAEISNFQTTPYWQPSDAIVGASTSASDKKVSMGDVTELSGSFRNAAFGKSSGGAGDLAIQNLTTGYSTLVTDMTGAYIWANGQTVTNTVDSKEYKLTTAKVLAEDPTTSTDKDGNLTYTIKIAQGLKFSDGSAITAKNYLYYTLAYSTKVMVAAGGSGSAGQYYVGYEAFNNNVEGGSKAVFSGIRLLDDYTFSVTVASEYADYYYVDLYAGFSPVHKNLYFPGNCDIKDDGNGCYITSDFYATTTKDGVETYTMAETIKANVMNTSAKDIPYSGPYIVSSYSNKSATLTKNTYYTGDHRGNGNVQTITYSLIVSETQLDQLKGGEIDILAGVTGATETEAALAVTKGENAKFKEVHYDRAGYGKLAFVSDFGPTQFTAVRQAVMYTINRSQFAQDFTGGHGSVVDGPYYKGSAAFQAVQNDIQLNSYELSAEKANQVLEEGGWIYNSKGKEFVAGKDDVRYKKLEGYELSYDNLNFASTDGKYKTVKIGDSYYMPLVINWTGTQPNTVTDQLITSWQTSATATSQIGMYITYKSGDFTTALYGDYYQMSEYGFDGTARCGAVNFATGFTSTVYDFSYNWTLDQDLYSQGYNMNMFMDEADFWSNY